MVYSQNALSRQIRLNGLRMSAEKEGQVQQQKKDDEQSYWKHLFSLNGAYRLQVKTFLCIDINTAKLHRLPEMQHKSHHQMP